MRDTVLFVDDEPQILNGIRRALRKEAFEMIMVDSPQEAINVLEKCPVDVIVVDQKMPFMSGVSLLRHVKAHHPSIARIMLTGHASLDVAMAAVNEGDVSKFFSKPLNDVQLAVAIRECLQNKHDAPAAEQMLDVLRMQSAFIRHLEEDYPGITDVPRDGAGNIVIEPSDDEPEAILREIEESEGRAR